MGGSISIPSATGAVKDNDVWLSDGVKITVSGNLTAQSPVATISLVTYTAGTQVLQAADGYTLTAEDCAKFAVENDAYYVGLDGGNGVLVPEGFVYVGGRTVIGKNNTDNYAGVFIAGRTVTLSPFMMCDHEVTQGEWKAVMGDSILNTAGVSDDPSYCKAGASGYQVPFGTVQENRPVEGVTWYDAVYYCNLRSKKEDLTPAYEITIKRMGDDNSFIRNADVSLVEGADGWRLPTEAEWEYAVRGGDPEAEAWDYEFSGERRAGDVFSVRDTGMDSVGWYQYNNDSWHAENWSRLAVSKIDSVTNGASGKGTHEVKQLHLNALDLYDMSGNVSEWCWDRYSDTVQPGAVTDPSGTASGSDRVFRGGSWTGSAYCASVCYRLSEKPGDRSSSLGFRVVRSVK